jgi:hypothetical protein
MRKQEREREREEEEGRVRCDTPHDVTGIWCRRDPMYRGKAEISGNTTYLQHKVMHYLTSVQLNTVTYHVETDLSSAAQTARIRRYTIFD